MSPDQRPQAAERLTRLARGSLAVLGRLPWSSNGTYLVRCTDGDDSELAVYKPADEERTLWDFPSGLWAREVAAFEVADALGWRIVPETVVREKAPLGKGSLQRFVDADFSEHFLSLIDDKSHHDALRRIAVFDLLCNNADRKSGHVIIANGPARHIYAIDHGLCFHREPKLRTVIWDFAGDPIPAALVSDVATFAADPASTDERLGELLDDGERAALLHRAAALVAEPRYPAPSSEHRDWPWPLV